MVQAIQDAAAMALHRLEDAGDSALARPRVFISYSHDSDEHKDWVRNLALRLQADGIKVTFDQQDLHLAMSPSSFMEESLAGCDRVILVVTEKYTSK
jgi:TIR domain